MIYIVYISFFCQCCRLLGQFLLPPSNNLPHTCLEVFLIMKEIGMEYQDIDVCLNYHIIYVMENMHKKPNAHNVKLVDIKLIK